MKFLCDQMLGTLAKWLRIYGFDTFYAEANTTDDELINISKEEGRILVSRDRCLIQIARRENIKTIELSSTDIDNQIGSVLKETNAYEVNVLSRCILCNSEIDEIKKDKVKEKVPERVFESNEKFWFCPKCKKIYWKGTHYENMINKINVLKNLH